LIASAPGKIFIFGEHAVVYGRHAIVTAINLRTYADVRKSDEFRIISPLGTTGLDMDVHPYITDAIKKLKPMGVDGCEIRVTSEIPVASGLGSSSAVTVSVIAGLNAEFDLGLNPDEIYEIARKVEKDIQGIASGTDPFISTYGGSYLIPERERIDTGDIIVGVINTGEKSITKEMVAKVAQLKKEYPEVVERIFDAIDAISLMAVKLMKNKEKEKIDTLIRINQDLLSSLGVSSPGIDDIINVLREVGISGKLTGAGGGGSVICIPDSSSARNLKEIVPGIKILRPENEGVKIHF